MADLTWIESLDVVQNQLAILIMRVTPDNTGEWEALEKMTAAHKQLRSIDRTPLSQGKLLI